MPMRVQKMNPTGGWKSHESPMSMQFKIFCDWLEWQIRFWILNMLEGKDSDVRGAFLVNSSSTRQHENTTMASAENVRHAHTIVQVPQVHLYLRCHSVSEKVGLGRWNKDSLISHCNKKTATQLKTGDKSTSWIRRRSPESMGEGGQY